MIPSATARSLDSPPAKKLRRLWWPRFVSTWIVIFLAACAAFATELPGWRAGATQYSHGWPLAYLHRDYADDPNVQSEIRLSQNIANSPQGIETAWKTYGLPWHVEAVMQPWSTANETSYSIWRATIDFAFVIAVAFAAGWIYQRRRARGRRMWQFRLRTALATTLVIAIFCAWAADWRDQLRAEHQLTDQLLTSNKTDISIEYGWMPPFWLPDCVAKLGNLGGQFDRVSICALRKNWATDETLASLRSLSRLRRLEIGSSRVTSVGLANLYFLAYLSELEFDWDVKRTLTAADGAAIARIQSLTDLYLERASPDAIAQFRPMPHLRSLVLIQLDSSAALASIEQLTQLESLNLSVGFSDPVQLRGLPNLHQLSLSGKGGNGFSSGSDGLPMQDAQLQEMPKLETVSLECLRVHVRGLPQLRDLSLTNISLDAAALRQIMQCPNLESLNFDGLWFAGGAPFEISNSNSLKNLIVNELQPGRAMFRDLPALQHLEIQNCDRLTALALNKLPKLEDLRIQWCSRLSALDVGRLVNLKSLTMTIYPRMVGDPTTYTEEAPQRSRKLRLIGLAHLTKMENLDLGGMTLDRRDIADVAKLANLQGLRWPTARLDDADVMQFSSLHKLTSLALQGNPISDAALSLVAKLPKLEDLWVNDTLVSHSGVKSLSAQFPKLEVYYEWEQSARADLKTFVDEARRGRHSKVDFSAPYVWNYYLGDSDLRQLSGLDDLGRLSLTQTHLTDAGLKSLSGLVALQSLDLSSTLVTDAGLASLSRFPELSALNLASTAICGDGLRYLEPLKNLKALDLSDTDITDESLDLLRFLPQLERLSLESTQITDAGLRRLQPLHNLRVLCLAATKISPAGLAQLRRFDKLETLGVGGDPTVEWFDALKQLPQLKTLYWFGSIEPANISRLAELKNLHSLAVGGQIFDSADLQAIINLPQLRELWLTSTGESAQNEALVQAAGRLKKLRLSGWNIDLATAIGLAHPHLKIEIIQGSSPVFDSREFDPQGASFEPDPTNLSPPQIRSPNGPPVVGAIIYFAGQSVLA